MNRSPNGYSAKMPKFSKFLRSRLALRQTAPAEHLDAEVLAAFAEQRLSAKERANALAHVAHCPDCREVLALVSDAASEPRPQESGFPLWAWGGTLAAALACLVLALIWPASLIRRAPQQPVLVARATAPPPPQLVSPPATAKQSIPKPAAAKKLSRPSPRPQNEALPQPQQPADMAIRTLPVPSGNAMFQAESRIAPERVMIAARDIQQPANLWRLNGDPGKLQKSTDGGLTWQTVRLNSYIPLDALSVTGPDIWVGGADAMLLHSADGGVHWNKLPVPNEKFEITQIESRDRYTLRLTMRSGEHWTTTDGGLHWRRE